MTLVSAWAVISVIRFPVSFARAVVHLFSAVSHSGRSPQGVSNSFLASPVAAPASASFLDAPRGRLSASTTTRANSGVDPASPESISTSSSASVRAR
jgi:hypothetical protein